MKPPGKTSLNRMQQTALAEMERIEISQDGRVAAGMIKEPMPEQVLKRDDFAGIVRLIDAIQADPTFRDEVVERLRRWAASPDREAGSNASNAI